MTGIREDIELLVEAKRVLKFQIGNDHLAAALNRIELKLRTVVDLMEKVNAFDLPRNEFLELHAQFILQDAGINVGQLMIVGAPKPAPKPRLELVVDNGPAEETSDGHGPECPCALCDEHRSASE